MRAIGKTFKNLEVCFPPFVIHRSFFLRVGTRPCFDNKRNVRLHRFDPEKINFDLVAQVVRHIHFQAAMWIWYLRKQGVEVCHYSVFGIILCCNNRIYIYI